jgi:hypothetical protein
VNWFRKRIDIRPTLLVGVIVAVLLAGAGFAYAVSVTNMTDTPLWPGHADITDSTYLTVDETTTPPGYRFVYAGDLKVDKVEVDVANSDTNDRNAKVEVLLLGSGDTVLGQDSTTQTIGATSTVTVDVPTAGGLNVNLANLVKINIIITDLGIAP